LNGADFTLQASEVVDYGGSCPAAPVTTTLTGTFDGPDAFTANAVRYFDLSVPCQCSALFSVTGTRL
jgi:hypothetical protein